MTGPYALTDIKTAAVMGWDMPDGTHPMDALSVWLATHDKEVLDKVVERVSAVQRWSFIEGDADLRADDDGWIVDIKDILAAISSEDEQ